MLHEESCTLQLQTYCVLLMVSDDEIPPGTPNCSCLETRVVLMVDPDGVEAVMRRDASHYPIY